MKEYCRLTLGVSNLTLINVWVPMNQAFDPVKDEFCVCSQSVFAQAPKQLVDVLWRIELLIRNCCNLIGMMCVCVYLFNPLKPNSANCYTLPYRPNLPFLISDIRALWRSALSARVPECQKLKMDLDDTEHYEVYNVRWHWTLKG